MKEPKLIDGKLRCLECGSLIDSQLRLTRREENYYDIREDNMDWYEDGVLQCSECGNKEDVKAPINRENLQSFKFELSVKEKINLKILKISL